ncbi:MAG: choice-of-anchor M domain-containing protein [Bifidobacteriaceae bacterium]|jgi:surface-anchored protein|nr:choice-of-anchor M domain-containing protein [Bifidobacteriaceae bacterium]
MTPTRLRRDRTSTIRTTSLLSISALVLGGISFLSSTPAIADEPAAAVERAVVDSGWAFLDTTLVDGVPTLGLVRSEHSTTTNAAANPVSYDLDEVVVRIDDSHKTVLPSDDTLAGQSWREFGPAGAEVWETSSTTAFSSSSFPSSDFLVAGYNARGIPKSALSSGNDRVTIEVESFAGPGRWYSGAGSATVNTMSTSRLDSFTEGGTVSVPAANAGRHYWDFTAAGVYCISFTATVTLASATEPVTSQPGTLRIIVGEVENWETAACGSGEEEYVPPEIDLMDPANNWLLPNAHADVAAKLESDGSLGLHLRSGRWWEFANTIVFMSDATEVTIPEPTATRDYTFIAPAGSTVWRLSKAPIDYATWLGFSSEHISDADFERLLTWQLYGVAGIDGGAAPGEFVLGAEESLVAAGGSPIFSTRQGMPQALQMIPAAWAHRHASWDFTAPGVYCLDMGMSGRLPDGTPVSDRQVMTVVVGGDSLNPKSMQTCMQAGITATDTPSANTTLALDTDAPIVLRPESTSRTLTTMLRPTVSDGTLTVDLVVEDQLSGGTAYDPNDVVIPVRAPGDAGQQLGGSRPWDGSAGDRYWALNGAVGRVSLGWDATRLPTSAISGDLGWTMTEIAGGDLILSDNYTSVSHQPVFSSRAGYESYSYPIWPETRVEDPSWVFKSTGVYCVAFEWSGTAAGGASLGPVQKTLTFAVGVDPAKIIPCSWEGGGDQGGGDDDDPDPGEEVPDDWSQLPLSGRHVLDGGHVDIRSVLTASEHTVAVHDDNTQPATLRAVGEVTFSVPPAAEQTVPSAEFAFLGAEGDSVWTLPQTAQAGLVWPGWNLELGSGSTATGVRWVLDEVTGPGGFALYQSLSFGDVSVLLDSDDPENSAFEVSQHGHGNWAFTAEGVYCVDLTVSPVPAADGLDRAVTLLFGVGGVDPERVTPEQCGKTPAQIVGSEPTPDPAVPATPGQPGITTDGSTVSVTWTAPDDGGSAITGYTVVLAGAFGVPLVVAAAADATSVVFTEVPAGSWTATVAAVNSVGSSEPSSASNAVTVASAPEDPADPDPDPGPEPTVPAAPAAPSVVVDGDAVTVSWVAPDDGGSPLTGFTVSLLGGGNPLVRDVGGDATSARFAGVDPGAYRATVIAVNAVGASAASPESAPVTIEPTASEPGPGEPDPGETDPGDPDPGEPDPGETDPGDPGPGEPDPGEPGPGDLDPGEPGPGERDPGDPDPGDPDPGDPDPGDPDPEVAPVPEGELTDASRGGVDVPDAAAPGAQIVVTVPGRAGQRVRVWLHSAPVLLGTVTLDADGRVVVTIPAGTPLGDHRVVVQALDGSLVGWDGIVIRAASHPADPDPGDKALPVTGADVSWPLIGAVGLLLLGAFARIRAREHGARPANA